MWTVADQQAQLQTSQFSAVLDIALPTQGLQELSFAGERLPSGALLGMSWATGLNPLSEIRDHYTSENSLVVRYADPGKDSHQMQLRWQFVHPQQDLPRGAVELVISLEASLLMQLPKWRTISRVSMRPVYGFGGEVSQTWQALSTSSTPEGEKSSPEEADCRMILCRFPGQDLSYVEMIHPRDPALSIFTDPKPGSEETICWGMQMAGDYLEKGVILRRRVRGVFLPAEQDEILAQEAYQQFLDLAPPLN